MSQANVDVVRTIYERFRAGDVEGGLELQHPEIQVHDRPEAPDAQVYRGHAGVLESLRVSQVAFSGLDIVPEEFVDEGDRVVVTFRFVGTGRTSGIRVDDRLVHIWTIRDGKAVRMEVQSAPPSDESSGVARS